MSRSRSPRGARKSRLSGTPTEGGSVGKRGHSNMEHSLHTAEIKEGTRHQRRVEDKEIVRKDLAEAEVEAG